MRIHRAVRMPLFGIEETEARQMQHSLIRQVKIGEKHPKQKRIIPTNTLITIAMSMSHYKVGDTVIINPRADLLKR